MVAQVNLKELVYGQFNMIMPANMIDFKLFRI